MKRNKNIGLPSFFLLLMLFEIFSPTISYALTSGPTQPEVQQFTPIGASDMVDLFTGDFSYNIPLFELPGPDGGYPFNLSYRSGISMDQEASWVGLGWNINVGAINRQVRGLPDDFNGDQIQKKEDRKRDYTVGVELGGDFQIAGQSFLTPKVNASRKIYFNSYKGVGLSRSAGIGATVSKGGVNASLGIQFNNDNIEGSSIQPSAGLGFSAQSDDVTVSGGLGITANITARDGLKGISLNADMSVSATKERKDEYGNKSRIGAKGSLGGTAKSWSFVNNGFSFNTTSELKGSEAYVTFTGEVTGFWIGAGSTITGFYNVSALKYKDTYRPYNAFGHNYLQNANINDKDIMDFTREGDLPFTKYNPTLAIPQSSYDIYSVDGQGIGSMFHSQRSDLGVYRDRKVETNTGSGSLELEMGGGPLAALIGFSLTATHSQAITEPWKMNGDVNDKLFFTKPSDKPNQPDFEPSYFQTSDDVFAIDSIELDNYIGGFEATRLNIANLNNGDWKTTPSLLNNKSLNKTIQKNSFDFRTPRNTQVFGVLNKYLQGNSNPLKQFYVNYSILDPATTNSTTLTPNNPSDYNTQISHNTKLDQIGAFEAINNNGIRYIYGLPAYNIKQVDCYFSKEQSDKCNPRSSVEPKETGSDDPKHDKYDKALNKTIVPSYTHAHLLTAVLGTDYIDVKNDGVTDDDLGYWVKFGYTKTTTDQNPYKWRSPFTGANYIPGLMSKNSDDKASYTYGERENWYLTIAETKTHRAEFYISQRNDAASANNELQNVSTIGTAKSFKLDSIALYSKSERINSNGTVNQNATPIKKIYFSYSYELCKDIPNNIVSGQGKLTLESLTFTYGDNQRGKLNPYVFNYDRNDVSPAIELNPDYSPYEYDRWGNYKGRIGASEKCKFLDYPYVDQNLPKKERDRLASVWNLQSINLPTGAKMIIDYESDDYAYVQHKQAMEMVPLKSINIGNLFTEDEEFIRFTLKEPIDPTLSSSEQHAELSKYFDATGQLYFKEKVKLTRDEDYEYVSGYADIKSYNLDLANDPTGKTAKVVLEPFKIGNNKSINITKNVHPFVSAAWNFIELSRPELMDPSSKAFFNKFEDDVELSTRDKLEMAKQFILMVVPGSATILNMKQFYTNAINWGYSTTPDQFNVAESYIRLNVVNKTKYGGGSRVKQISIIEGSEMWQDTIGTVYEYKTNVGIDTFSSGVATYEPNIGNEENALKFAQAYATNANKVAVRSNYRQYNEMPFNEGYFPSASVGYSKVTVRSLATNKVYQKKLDTLVATTGETVNEFYTSKDFPTIYNYTIMHAEEFVPPPTIPFGYEKVESKLTGTQGFYIELNDMNGKPKATTIYPISKSGNMNHDAPISKVEYIYKSKPIDLKPDPNDKYRVTAKQLLSTVNVLKDLDHNVTPKLVGVDYELLTDLREETNGSFQGSGNVTVSGQYIGFVPVIIPGFMLNIRDDIKTARTAVTNKIIQRTGILDSTIVTKEGGKIITTNEIYDEQTGTPILTKITNEYNNNIYNLTIPAYWQYDKMGVSYKNIGFQFDGDIVSISTSINPKYKIVVNNIATADKLIQGDELLVGNNGIYSKAYVVDVVNQDIKIDFNDNPLTGLQHCIIVRSGNRNMQSMPAGSINALVDPLQKILK